MNKFICLIFLPMVLSQFSDQPPADFHPDHESTSQLSFSAPPSSDITLSLTTNVACACDSRTDWGKPKRDDYQYTPGIGAHKLHTRGFTFNKAREVCYQEGGHLAIINSLAEEQVLLGLFNRSSEFLNVLDVGHLYLGIHDLYEEGVWVTILGEPLSATGYSKWSPSWLGEAQPNNDGGYQNCGALLIQGGMNDVECNKNYAFVCELPQSSKAH